MSLYYFFNQKKKNTCLAVKNIGKKSCCNQMRNSDLEADCAWVQIPILLLESCVTQSKYLMSLICKMGIIEVPTSQDYHEDCMRSYR